MSAKPVFLSSCFRDPIDTPLSFRDRIRNETGGTGEKAKLNRPIWMAEDFSELRPDYPLGPFEKTELCLDGVRQAQCVVAVITARHGSSIAFDGLRKDVPTTFFEAELFEAALLRKPTYIFFLKGYEPEGSLAALLTLLKPAFPHYCQSPLSEDEIVRRIMRLADRYHRPVFLYKPFSSPKLSTLVDKLRGLRHSGYDIKAQAPPLKYLDGAGDPTVPQPDMADVANLLDRADRESKHQIRLTLIWIAIRALMGAHYRSPANRDFLPLWQRAFGAWSGNGAWYGLHGHFPLSCLAATSSIAEIQFLSNPQAGTSHDYPHGTFASLYYSIAKQAGFKRPLFDLALEHINLSMEIASGSSGDYAVRGSIFLQTGCVEAALRDYQCVVEMRHSNGGQSYGDALSELGYAQVIAGQKRRGIENLEKGVEILSEGPPNGFRVRAMRKLAVGYFRAFKIRDALDMSANAYGLANQMGACDQIRALEKVATMLTRRN